ncbi:MAG: site-specific DNA-methyltransferase [Lachnospiraceae bacterium]|nr:site-specific DNA-methyltransferase [Lachnospiraceae bacterium]
MEINKIYNKDCIETMRECLESHCVDVILTSPPYNMTKRKGGYADTGRYDVYEDWKTEQEYIDWIVDIFNGFDKVLKENGVVLFNINYSIENPILPYKVICEVDEHTSFTVVDTISWKKKYGLPFPANCRRLDRIWELVFVLTRKNEIDTFNTNIKVKSIAKTGQLYYETTYNFVEASNNDGKCDLNQATYSTDLCRKLLNIYARPGSVVYDPFSGTGTTSVAAKQMGLNYLGSEISSNQVEFSEKRLREIKSKDMVEDVFENNLF